jgi:hypothetical protein
LSAPRKVPVTNQQDRQLIEMMLGRVLHTAIPFSMGSVSRSSRMTYDYASPVTVGDAVYNSSSQPISREIGGTIKVGTSQTWGISATAEANLGGILGFSVTASYSQTWTREEEFKDFLTIPIQPGYMVWLERETVMRHLEGPFVGCPMVWREGYRWSGNITAPGIEGTLKHRVVVREAKMSAQHEGDIASLFAVPEARECGLRTDNGNGVYTLPAHVAASLAEPFGTGEITSTDVS